MEIQLESQQISMSSPFDTIVAPITGAENAAVAVVRVSGAEAWEVAAKVFRPWPEAPQPRFALYGHFVTGDDGLALPFAEDHSYTGDQTVEFSVHGSRASVQALVEACLQAGARMARPGEFTERAFLNGRLDLTQAEGVRDTVEALTQTQLRQANLLREGALRDQVRVIRAEVEGVLAAVEASVDFSEEIGDLDRPEAVAQLGIAIQELDRLLLTQEAGRILRRGYRIAIVGPPNAGKSSLLNALLGFDRSIVTEVPGTTRDFVEERIDLGGVPCVLTDTAGLRETEDRVETIGVERSRRVAEAADEVWYIVDGTVGLTPEDEFAIEAMERPVVVVWNKADLLQPDRSYRTYKTYSISALTRQNLDLLVDHVKGKIDSGGAESVWINDRHAPLLQSARQSLEAATKTLSQDLPFDLASVHLQAAIADFGQITGESAGEDVLDAIFRNFCIGK